MIDGNIQPGPAAADTKTAPAAAKATLSRVRHFATSRADAESRLNATTSTGVDKDTFGGYPSNDIDIFDLTKFTLKIRPDYLIVGEAGEQEIQFLFQASAPGHSALSRFQGDSVESALHG